MQLPQVSIYLRFSAEIFNKISSHICCIYVAVINRYYDCDITYKQIAYQICNIFVYT